MARTKNVPEFWSSLVENTSEFVGYYNKMENICLSEFRYENLPDTMDARYIEEILYKNGAICVFEDPQIGLLALPFTPGKLDFNGYPIERFVYSEFNGYHNIVYPNNSIIIYNDMNRTASAGEVMRFAYHLYNMEQTIAVNINAQKTPLVLKCSENQRLTIKNLYKEYSGNAIVICVDEGMNDKPLTALSTNAPFNAPQIYDLKSKTWNDFLAFRGIASLEDSKKERRITSEVNSMMGGALANRLSYMNPRIDGINKVNKMFRTNIVVSFGCDSLLESIAAEKEDSTYFNKEEEGVDNG